MENRTKTGVSRSGGQKSGRVDGCRVAEGPEEAVGRGATSVHHPLRDAFVIEVGDLLPEVEILQQRRPALAGLERMIGVGQSGALRRRQVVPSLRTGIDTPAAVANRPPRRAEGSGCRLIGMALRGHGVNSLSCRGFLYRSVPAGQVLKRICAEPAAGGQLAVAPSRAQ